ncbi:hypothetical protein NDU88_000434 [Pleurodeles waltl]|uniref:Uncharacterized protein n=1 Tax=Pleurodeles waltl TaxID=8319 RepID=A0AAV7V8X6_PLEWA|nr:hypothetical protein NDU88_000434 [Pleurodeles waltl]
MPERAGGGRGIASHDTAGGVRKKGVTPSWWLAPSGKSLEKHSQRPYPTHIKTAKTTKADLQRRWDP